MATVAYSIGTMGIELTGLFLFLVFFCFGCWFFYGLKPSPNSDYTNLQGQYSPLACLWEDAPQSALKGQAYQLATPFACIVRDSWISFYRENLGKPGIDYWQWANFPESQQVCRELTALLSLKPPSVQVKSLLFSLQQQSLQMFVEGDLCQQLLNYFLFKDWHETTYNMLGKGMTRDIYQRCFNVSGETINQILNLHHQQEKSWWEVLNVKESAEKSEVEKAYKKLIRNWHPDLNPSPYAHQFAIMINLAYEQYHSLSQPRNINSFFELLYKIYDFFSSLKRLYLPKL